MSKHFWYVARNEIIFSMLKQYCDLKGKMLEVGCGEGDVLLFLKSKSMNVEALDMSQSALFSLSKKEEIVSYCIDICKTDINSQFDIVGCFDVLEHIEDDELALRRMYNCLKPNGKIILTVPAFSWLWSSFDVFCEHFRRYNSKSIQNKIRNSGFKIIKSSYFMFFLFPVILLIRFFSRSKIAKEYAEEKTFPFLNDVFLFVFRLDRFLMKFVNLPYGSSIIVVAEKK